MEDKTFVNVQAVHCEPSGVGLSPERQMTTFTKAAFCFISKEIIFYVICALSGAAYRCV